MENNTNQVDSYLHHIRNSCPDLEVRTAQLSAGGEVNDILIINEEWIFRFPKSSGGLEQLNTELAILGTIQGHVSTPVPNPVYTGKDLQTVGAAFMGYRKLPGEILDTHLENAREKDDGRQIAQQLAAFLKELHGFPLERTGLKAPVHDRGRREALPGEFKNIRENLYPYMRPDACTEVSARFNEFLNTSTGHEYEQVLRHGDLGPRNILVNPHSLAITGILDFGSAGLDDPAIDLGFISFWGEALLGTAFVQQFYAGYGVSEMLLNRARFHKILIAMLVAMQGLQNSNPELFNFAIRPFIE
jgi:aminoglycoside 2''-phosphotransferase